MKVAFGILNIVAACGLHQLPKNPDKRKFKSWKTFTNITIMVETKSLLHYAAIKQEFFALQILQSNFQSIIPPVVCWDVLKLMTVWHRRNIVRCFPMVNLSHLMFLFAPIQNSCRLCFPSRGNIKYVILFYFM